MNIQLCAYGCGQEAKYQLKNDKWCCNKSYNSCPELKRKNSEQIKQAHKEGRCSSKGFNSKRGWSKGKTKYDSDVLHQRGKILSKKYQTGKLIPYFLGKRHSNETIDKLVKGMLCSTRKKGISYWYKGWYKGYWCDSSWELAWVVYNLEHGIKFQRNTQGFDYEFKDKKYRFYPDFLLENGQYVEIKGYCDKKNETKIQQFKGNLQVLQKEEMKLYLEYVISKYGKKFISLYETNN